MRWLNYAICILRETVSRQKEKNMCRAFDDDDLERLEKETRARTVSLRFYDLAALVFRLKAAELKDCNQDHCGHPTCNAWRIAAGKRINYFIRLSKRFLFWLQ